MNVNKHHVTVFISSAMRELEAEREIAQEALAHAKMDPVAYELFPSISQSPMEACIDKVKKCDIFVLILWKSLRPAVEEELAAAIKNNKPILLFVKTLLDGESRASNTSEFLTQVQQSNEKQSAFSVSYRPFRGLAELRQILCDSIAEETAKLYRMPDYTLAKHELYDLGTEIIAHARKRLFIFQRTPSLLLGPRPYLDESKSRKYERDFYSSLKEWIQTRHENPDCEFFCLFSMSATQTELQKYGLLDHADYLARLRVTIDEYDHIEESSGGRFMVRMTDDPVSGPHIVGDDRFAVWLFGGDDAVAVGVRNEKLCDAVTRMLRTRCRLLTARAICEEGSTSVK
ncbi:MAG: DUF4062 domain-containing protein [Verrucomicrobia bacterium]|nr:DUF4062 domain-containing protein [Verrucomicrobiota bacterium]